MSKRNQALGKRQRNAGAASDPRVWTADEVAAMALKPADFSDPRVWTADEVAAMALKPADFSDPRVVTADDIAAMTAADFDELLEPPARKISKGDRK